MDIRSSFLEYLKMSSLFNLIYQLASLCQFKTFNIVLTPPFLKGGSAFLKMGLRGGLKIFVFKGEDTQKGGSKIKGGFRPLSTLTPFCT